MKYEAGKKYRVEAKLSVSNRNITVLVDGKQIGLRMFYAPVHSIERIAFSTGESNEFPTPDTPADQDYDLPNAGGQDPLATFRIANFKTESFDNDSAASFLKFDNFKHYVDYFNGMEDENIILRAQLKDRYNFPNLVGQSPSFQAVLKTVMKVASTDATVLLFGESGTGKELIAKTIHFQSKRAKGPFVAINCAAIPENLLEAELFGSEKGAFTGAVKRIGKFEQANGGTIFLDEIAELPLSLQPKLLRVLQERTVEPLGSSKTIRVDVRLISATNKDLSEEIRKGNFREDLFWRLNVIPIYIPPLRERKEDIPLLVEYYLKSFCNIYRKSVSIDEEALKVLVSYDWPGNVRELANTIERLVVMTESSKIKVYDLPDTVRGVFKLKPYSLGDLKLPTEVEELERIRIMDTLPKFNFNIRKTAQALGLTERQLNYRIKKYGIIIKKGVNLHDSDN